MKKIAIVGGGVGGMAAAYDLSRAGNQVTIFDPASQLGRHGERRQPLALLVLRHSRQVGQCHPGLHVVIPPPVAVPQLAESARLMQARRPDEPAPVALALRARLTEMARHHPVDHRRHPRQPRELGRRIGPDGDGGRLSRCAPAGGGALARRRGIGGRRPRRNASARKHGGKQQASGTHANKLVQRQ